MTSLFRLVPLLLLNKVHNLVSAKELAMPINFAFRDIDHILSLINSKFNVYVDHIYHMQRDINTTTDTDRTTPYLDHIYNLTMKADYERNQRQRDYFIIFILDFLFTRTNISAEPAYGISHMYPYHMTSFDELIM